MGLDEAHMPDDNHDTADDPEADVPATSDMRILQNAIVWTQSAQDKRPAREAFFTRFVSEVVALGPRVKTILELGSGPGFLAERLLRTCPQLV